MRLKTLKDMKLGYEGYPPEDENIRKQLKQEAIKWVKKFSMKTKEGIEMSNVAGAFKLFFNITESELENEK